MSYLTYWVAEYVRYFKRRPLMERGIAIGRNRAWVNVSVDVEIGVVLSVFPKKKSPRSSFF